MARQDPLMAESLILSVDDDGEAMLGYYEGLNPHAAGGSVPVSKIGNQWHVGFGKLLEVNAEWIAPLIQQWKDGRQFDLGEVINLYVVANGRMPDQTSMRFHQFPSVAQHQKEKR